VPATTHALSADAVLGARPEHIIIDGDGTLRGEVRAVEYMGARQLITVATEAGALKVRTGNHVRVAGGETVGLSFLTDRLSVFDEVTDRSVTAGDAGG
ncbi:MAG: TOBE domain-containing protein, partial [Pseudomonadota bacterium]